MINIAVCDDQKSFRDNITRSIDKYFKSKSIEYHIDFYDDGKPIVEVYETNSSPYDIVFLDMKMTSLNGDAAAEIIRSYDKKVILIFVSSWIDYAVTGYNVDAHRFIYKSDVALDSAVSSTLDSSMRKINSSGGHIIITSEDSQMRINVSDILFVEVFDKIVSLYTEKEKYQTTTTLAAVEHELEGTSIIRCHRSYLVNVRHITAFRKDSVTLSNNRTIPVSRSSRKTVLDLFTRFLAGE
ncbi:MAG: LytTR family DNA-binding domain-containing protein [Oscillospiraceae bacterium]|jgi:DNA-binding LytR/AlgR family response regulator|nr:LytTR family DNA-binding domain-containing protein [Oscillospiraceae bacterium]